MNEEINLKGLTKEEIYEFRDFLQEEGESLKLKDLEIEFVESGRSDSGDHDLYIYTFKINKRYFQIYGYYSSENGVDVDDWTNIHEVIPTQRTITIYERKK